ncbi:MAG: MliC family protein [Candidatus Competibacter sp.]|nr:MliC family protein [Candidatus Competibacter sp.]
MAQFRISNTTLLGLILALTAGDALSASNDGKSSPPTEALCSDTWYRSIEEKVSTGDGRGHGPDVGSDEWKSVVEFRLGIRGQPDVPTRDSQAWCRHIDQIVRNRPASATGSGHPGRALKGAGPSFACDKVEAGSIEAMICGNAELSALDRKLSGVYAAASRKATNEHPPRLKAEQNGWIKGRNECWKSRDRNGCVRDEYQRRIAELQARYRLVPGKGPVRFLCDGSSVNEVVATFFQTDPPTLIAERGDSVSLMYLQPNGSGAKYQGRNETFWEHHGEASITWGHGAPEMHCKQAP